MTGAAERQREKTAIRRAMRRARRSLTPEERARADRAIRKHITRLAAFRNARNIAMYFAFDGEPNIGALLEDRRNRGKRFFAPIITRRDMRFGRVDTDSRLRSNRFGIAEGRAGSIARPQTLDVVLVPLVAFDRSGSRLGMGAGYYDRHFQALRHRKSYIRPKLVGVAYSCQQVDPLQREWWDVPLWGAITEAGFYRFGGL